MRDIKFRGKAVDGSWVEGYYGVLRHGDKEKHYIMKSTVKIKEDGTQIYFEDIQVDPETVGQYTGLDDAYEDDVLEVTSSVSNEKYYYVIKWDAEHARFMALSLKGTLRELVSATIERGGVNIGSIHEHPHLLKGEEK